MALQAPRLSMVQRANSGVLGKSPEAHCSAPVLRFLRENRVLLAPGSELPLGLRTKASWEEEAEIPKCSNLSLGGLVAAEAFCQSLLACRSMSSVCISSGVGVFSCQSPSAAV